MIKPKTASALVPSDLPLFIRNYYANYDNGGSGLPNCTNNPNKEAVTRWVSPLNDPTSIGPINANRGDTVIHLQFQESVFLCHDLVNVDPNRPEPAPLPNDGTPNSKSDLQQTAGFVDSMGVTPDGSLNPNFSGQTFVVPSYSSTRYWFGSGAGTFTFDYNTAPLEQTKTITVTVNVREANMFHGIWYCVANGAQVGSPPQCPITSYSFNVQINVPNPTVQGHVFVVNTNGDKVGDVSSSTITTCWPNPDSTTTTDTNGFFTFYPTQQAGFCARIKAPGNFPSGASLTGPFLRPWGETYNGDSGCQAFGGPPFTGHCNTVNGTYECQVAGGLFASCSGVDRTSDGGFDFVYVAQDVPVQAHVYEVDKNGYKVADLNGINFGTRCAPAPTPNGNGFYTFTIPYHDSFCLEGLTGAPSDAIGPYIRPWSEGYGNDRSCPGRTSSTDPRGTTYYPSYCSQQSYQWQVAGVDAKTGGWPAQYNFYDRASDSGYDFVFIKDNPPTATIVSGDCSNLTLNNVSDPDQPNSDLTMYPIVDGAVQTSYPSRGHGNNVKVYIGRFADLNAHSFGVQVISKDPNGNDNPKVHKEYYWPPPIGPCASPTCAGYQPSAAIEPNTPFNLTVSIKISGLGGAPSTGVSQPNYQVDAFITPEPGAASPRATYKNMNYTAVPPASQINATQTGISLGTGYYDLVWQLRNASGSKIYIKCPGVNGSPPGTIKVETKPYFRTYGGDTVAGSFASCWGGVPSGKGGIYGFNDDNDGKGAAAQLAAMALQNIIEFPSAVARGAPPVSPIGLTFANTGTPGNFGNSPCPTPDYFTTPPTGTNLGPSPTIYLAPGTTPPGKTALSSGVYTASGNVIIMPSRSDPLGVPAGKKIILYVRGNVAITGTDLYTDGIVRNYDTGKGNWQINDIPSVTIIAEGNIYIQDNVDEIAANLISKKTIYTCTQSTPAVNIFTYASKTDMAASGGRCGKWQLRVYGSFTAPYIKLFRSSNTANMGSPGEDWTSSKAAEIFELSPESWLTDPPQSSTTSNSGDYDSITSLPPVL